MSLVSTSDHVVEAALQNGCFQSLCPQSESSFLLPLWEALQDQQLPLVQAPFKLLLQTWVLEHVRCCISRLRAVSISYGPLALRKVSRADHQSPIFWEIIFI